MLPTCVNTSFGFYAGNWTMATMFHPQPNGGLTNGSATPGSRGTTAAPPPPGDTGLLTATAWDPEAFDVYTCVDSSDPPSPLDA